jgi:hypothetical protein
MNCMFRNAPAFDQEIDRIAYYANACNTSSVINMSYMFRTATAFNRHISNWNTNSITEHELHVP